MPYTVMLVDNEAIIPRGLMCLIDWKAHNCCVRAIANDGVDAVHQIQESPPDILITDIRMPEMDGLQLCGWVREHYPGIQMILLTGFPDFEYAQYDLYSDSIFILSKSQDEYNEDSREISRIFLSPEKENKKIQTSGWNCPNSAGRFVL